MENKTTREGLLSFLDDLKQNNNKEWFQENKARYAVFKASYHSLIGELLSALAPFDPRIAGLEPKDCAFRINRDIRFSKNKEPYKTNLGIWIKPGDKKSPLAGYYVHIENGSCFVGGGLYQPMPEELQKIRKEIAFFYDDLKAVIKAPAFKKTYGDLAKDPEISLKNPPKGYEKEHPAIDYLKLKSFTATHPFDYNLVKSDAFVPTITESLKALKPLIDFLNRGLES